MKHQLKDYATDLNNIPIKCENKSVICLIRNLIQHSRSNTLYPGPFSRSEL